MNETKSHKLLLKIIVLIILFAILIYFFLVFLKEKPTPSTSIEKERPTRQINQEPESPTAYAQVDSLNTLNSSDEIWAIEADLESTDLSSFLLEIPAIENELGFSLNQTEKYTE